MSFYGPKAASKCDPTIEYIYTHVGRALKIAVDNAVDRAAERAIERAVDRAVVRAAERAVGRAVERVDERAVDRAVPGLECLSHLPVGSDGQAMWPSVDVCKWGPPVAYMRWFMQE